MWIEMDRKIQIVNRKILATMLIRMEFYIWIFVHDLNNDEKWW
jgi:hypothetical protein